MLQKIFDVGNMGIAALESHAEVDKHKMKLPSSGTVNIQQFYIKLPISLMTKGH